MKLADFKLNKTELSIETKLRIKQHEQEMELLMNLFDIESLDDEDVMQEIVELEKETITQEMIEDELSSIEFSSLTLTLYITSEIELILALFE